VTTVPEPIDPRAATRIVPIEVTPVAGAPAPASAPELMAAEVRYVGLITRGIAFALDAAVINVVAIFVEVGLALILSLLHLPHHQLRAVVVALGAAAYVLWSVGYFVGFWSTAGQTPGNRIMRIRVVAVKGERLKPRRALVRCIGLVLAALPLFAGYLMILFNRRRRGLQDYLARTVVIEAPQVSFAEARRTERRTASAARAAAAGSGPAAALTQSPVGDRPGSEAK
jgi:uncharacterized RDD family membrane protein YckC